MKPSTNYLLLFLLAPVFSFGQIKFEKVYGNIGNDFGYSVAQMYDTGYAVVGSSSSFGAGNTDVYLLKTDKYGMAVGQKTFGGINIDQGFSISTTTDSGLVMAGYTNSYGHGGYDMYVIKTNKNCDSTWTKTIGGTNWDFAYSIQQTADTGFIVAGSTFSFGHGNEDMYLVKLNKNGDTVWTKTYGGIYDDQARSVKQTSDGGYILTGMSKSFGDAANGDIWTVKTDSNGDTLWTFKFQTAGVDHGYDIIEDNLGGGYIIGGDVYTPGQGIQGLVARINLSGNFISAAYYGGGTTVADGTHSITQTADGRFATMGYTNSYGAGMSDFVFYLENPIGTYIGSVTFGGPKVDKGYCVKSTYDGGFIICGTTLSFSTFERIYLIKTDSLGASTGSVISFTTDISSATSTKIDGLLVYPNPANGLVYIQSASSLSDPSISITDLLGRTLYSEKMIGNALTEPLEVDLANFTPGVYLINILSEGRSSVQKLIIQK